MISKDASNYLVFCKCMQRFSEFSELFGFIVMVIKVDN